MPRRASKGITVKRSVPTVCLLTAILLCATGGPTKAAQPFAAMTEKVITQYVRPRFAALEQETAKLADDLDATCAGKPGRLTAARADFKRTALAWAEVEFLRFGPLSVTGRPERFFFWPDPRGVMHRQLRRLIARRDPAALDPDTLANKSAAIQGLPALETLLWDSKHPIVADDETGRYRCRLAVSIAHNLATLAGELLAGWQRDGEWRRRMLNPGPQNASYKTAAEPPAEFARALITGLQMMQDRQVVPLMAAEANPGKSPRLPFQRSGLSADYIAAAIASCKALYEAMGLADGVPRAKAWMPRWIKTAFKRLAEDAPAAVREEPSYGKDPERARTLRFVRFHVEGIRKLVGRELAPLAGLTIGFNELDGD